MKSSSARNMGIDRKKMTYFVVVVAIVAVVETGGPVVGALHRGVAYVDAVDAELSGRGGGGESCNDRQDVEVDHVDGTTVWVGFVLSKVSIEFQDAMRQECDTVVGLDLLSGAYVLLDPKFCSCLKKHEERRYALVICPESMPSFGNGDMLSPTKRTLRAAS
jgi:hypothetical protein